MSSGGKKPTLGYWYRLLYHFGLFKGPVDALLEFRGGDRVAWKGLVVESGRITVNAPNLWGGEKSEGGIEGEMDIMMGESTQMPNDYLTDQLGADQPAYRGKLTAVWRGGRWGAMNPYPKTVAFKVRRILKGWDNDTCWYPERAVIPLIPTDPLALYFALDLSGSMGTMTPNGKTRLENMVVAVTSVLELIREVVLPIVTVDIMIVGWGGTAENYLSRVSITRRGVTGTGIDEMVSWLEARTADYGTYFPSAVEDAPDFFAGTAGGFVPISLFVTDGSPTIPGASDPVAAEAAATAAGETLLAIPGLRAYGFNIDLSNTAQTAKLDNTSTDGVPILSGDDPSALTNAIFEALGGLLAMNPIHIIYDSLTAQDMQGEPIAMISDASFRAAADRVFSEAFGLCTTYDGGPIRDFQQRICDVIGANMSQSRTDGMYYIDLVRGQYDLESLPIISSEDIVEFGIEPSVLTEQVNQITVEWFDPQKKVKRATSPVQALGSIQAAGRVIPETRSYPEIAAEFLALRVAGRDLQAASAPLSRMTITMNRRQFDLRPGRPFRLQYPEEGIADMVCLLGDADSGDLIDGQVRIVAIQDVFTMPQTVYVAPESGLADEPDATPVASPHQLLLEAPYVDLAGALSNAELAAFPEDAAAVLTIATRAPNGLNYSIYTAADGELYADNGSAEWCPSALVVEAASYLDTDFTLSGIDDLQDVEVGTWALWDDEIVRVDAVDTIAGTLSVARGCADTVPMPHLAGARIYFAGDWSGTDGREYVDGDTVRAKLLTRTISQELALTSAPELSAVMDQRQYRPYPPGAFTIDGEPYPAEVNTSETTTFGFTHRDRLLQGDKLFDTTVADIGPEPDTTYSLELRNASNDSLLLSATGQASSPIVLDTTVLSSATIKALLWSERGGIASFQKHEHEFEIISPVLEYIVAFTATGAFSWEVPPGVTEVDVLVVAGGGGGGSSLGAHGGAGAGGVIWQTGFAVSGTVTGNVGAGGLGRSNANGLAGENSTFGGLTAIGGAAGGIQPVAANGGSGAGGNSNATPNSGYAGGLGTSGQGNNGGAGNYSGTLNSEFGGGGGGAGAVGQDATPNVKAGNGGAGVDMTAVFGTTYGALGWFGGGGGGASRNASTATRSFGGQGGGGDGGYRTTVPNANGKPGTANSGGGGGSGQRSADGTASGGSGGSGIVLIRYLA